MESVCQRHGSNQNSQPPVLVRKPLCNQLIHYHDDNDNDNNDHVDVDGDDDYGANDDDDDDTDDK